MFPKDFRWGSATAAIQIEGAASADRKGPSVWDTFCRVHPERIHQGATPEVACDHYHRFAEDVGWIAQLGHNAYRFSISWPRVLPQGSGWVNPAGLDFYDRLVDALCATGISPNATLYHWDLPEALGMLGGWENPRTVDAYLEFAELCFGRLGDRVDYWCTFNEPAWTLLNGYITALHPPCRHDPAAAVLASHHMMLAHHLAHQLYSGPGKVGMALNLSPIYPATDQADDIRAARTADGVLNRWFLEALVEGRYPAEVVTIYDRRGLLPAGYHTLGGRRPDFIGVNYYYPHHAVAPPQRNEFHLNNDGDPNHKCRFSLAGCFAFVANTQGRFTDWNWEIHPQSLETLLQNLHQRWPDLELLITENGLGLPDQPGPDGIDDQPRIDFVGDHLRAVARALESGVKVGGYYMLSLMDNFSWVNGYKKRYGFLYVNRETMERTPKKSAAWFRRVIQENRVPD